MTKAKMIDKSYIDRLKDIPITDYLAEQGFVPTNRIGNQLVYLSPLTGEKTPSFFVHPEKNVFNCFSSGHKGDIITLVRQLEQVEFQQALVRLGRFSSSDHSFDPARLDRFRFNNDNQLKPAARQPTEYEHADEYADDEHKTHDVTKQAIESASQLELLAVKTLSNRVLINYLHSRGVSDHLASVYLKEAYFRVQGKNLFALAFENDKQGYELRNPFYKGCALVKAPTTVSGIPTADHQTLSEHPLVGHLPDTDHPPDGLSKDSSVNIFEGVFDFLSALTYYKTERFRNDSIILNSLWLFDSSYQNQLVEKYGSYNLFLDNDRAGWKKAIEFRKRVKTEHGTETQVINRSSLYKSFKDFNEFLLSQ